MLNTELLFSDKGFKTTEEDADYATMHFSYLNLPVLMGYKVQNLSILAGPEFGYLLSTISRNGYSDSFTYKGFWSKFDFGLGLGVQYAITQKINLDVRYTQGITPVLPNVEFTDENGMPIENARRKSQNRAFQLSLGYVLFRKD